MASRQTYDVVALGPHRTIVFGSFRPQDTSALVDADTAPKRSGDRGFSVARADVGLYTVTFDDKWKDLEACFVSVREAAAAPTFAQGGDYSAANRTLQIRVMQESAGALAEADLADDVDNRVSFLCIFRNTTIGGSAAT